MERRPLLYDSSSFVQQRQRPSTRWWQWTIGILGVACVSVALIVVTIHGLKVPQKLQIEIPAKTIIPQHDNANNLRMSIGSPIVSDKGSLIPKYSDEDKPDIPDVPEPREPPEPKEPREPKEPDERDELSDEVQKNISAAFADINKKIASKYLFGESVPIPQPGDDKNKTAQAYTDFSAKINSKFAKHFTNGDFNIPSFKGENDTSTTEKPTLKNVPPEFGKISDPSDYAKQRKDVNDKYAKPYMIGASNAKGGVSGEQQSSNTGDSKSWSDQMKFQKDINGKYADINGSLKSPTFNDKAKPNVKKSYMETNKEINDKFTAAFAGRGSATSYADYNSKINEKFASKYIKDFTGVDKPLLKSTEEPEEPPSRSYFEEHRKINNKFRSASGGVTIPDTPSTDYTEFGSKYSDYAKKSNPGSNKLYMTAQHDFKEKAQKIYHDAKVQAEKAYKESIEPYYKGQMGKLGSSGGNPKHDALFQGATMSMFERAQQNGEFKLEKRRILEEDLRHKGIELNEATAAGAHQRFLDCKPRALKLAHRSVIKEGASELLKKELNLTNDQCTEFLPLLEEAGQEFFDKVDGTEGDRCWADKPYRIADGACNNMEHPVWGAAFSPYKRLLPAEYEDGLSRPRLGSSGQPLPSPRQISATLSSVKRLGDSKATLMSVLWGLFVDHDLTNTAGSKSTDGKPITCCHPMVLRNESLRHPECMAICVSKVDPFFGPMNITCQEFVRSAPANYRTLGPRNQMNQITSYLDASAIYGSSEDDQDEMRTHTKGQLRISLINGTQEMLPTKDDPLSTCGKPQLNQRCFKSGDVRVNEQVELMTIHAIFHREHNRVAKQLAGVNPNWNDQRLFQEAKKVVVAELQHITYNEYLPLLLGPRYIHKYGLDLTEKGEYYDKYIPAMDATISNVFGAAAFRFGHSQVKSFIELVDSSYQVVENRTLRKTFFNPETIYQKGLDPHIRGLVHEKANTVDNYESSELRDHLFEPESGPFGIDLTAITVARGRDHGLAPYPKWREFCGLSAVKDWDDLKPIAGREKLSMMKQTYDSVKDIDFVVGALSEPKVPGGLVGPTHACLIAEQFERLRKGDRYWYENKYPAPFTREQLLEIKKVGVARLLCDNSDNLETVTAKPLERLSNENPLKKCQERHAIPEINFKFWYEDFKNPLPSSAFKP